MCDSEGSGILVVVREWFLRRRVECSNIVRERII